MSEPAGVQQPATLWVPERRGSYGPVIIDWAESIGIGMDPEQRRDIDAMASFGPGGLWLTLETAIIEGRQNGKTKSVMLPIALADLFLFPPPPEPDRIIWTSHLMKTSLDTFGRVKNLIESNASMSRRVKEIHESKSEQAIEMMDGSTFEFLARTVGGGRGLSMCKRIVFDEALFLRVTSMGALIPTMRAHPNPQLAFGSSAGRPESDHLRSLQARGRRGGDDSLIFIEYKADGSWAKPGCARGKRCTHIYGVEGCTLDDEQQWRKANHAIDRGRMRVVFLRSETRALRQTPEGVLESGREMLGWEEDGEDAAEKPIPLDVWAKRTDEASRIVGAITIGIDIPPDRKSASVAVAGRREDGRAHLELARADPGVDWVVAQVVKMLAEQEVYDIQDGKAVRPAIVGDKLALTPLLAAFRAEGIIPVLSGPAELAQGCGLLQDAFENDTARHIGQDQLTTALGVAVKRDSGDSGWLWGKRLSAAEGADISGVVALTEAHRALTEVRDDGVWGFFE